jgi:hypothetical protein
MAQRSSHRGLRHKKSGAKCPTKNDWGSSRCTAGPQLTHLTHETGLATPGWVRAEKCAQRPAKIGKFGLPTSSAIAMLAQIRWVSGRWVVLRVVGFILAIALASCAQEPPPQPVAIPPAQPPPPSVVVIEKPAPPPRIITKEVVVEKPVVVEKEVVRERPAPPPKRPITIEVKPTLEIKPTIVVGANNETESAKAPKKAPAPPTCKGLAQAACLAGCTWVQPYTRANGTKVAGYCHVATTKPKPVAVKSNCHWVSGYTRKDGREVSGYQRCR